MKINNKATVLLFLAVVILTACNGLTSPSMLNPTDVMETSLAFAKTEMVETSSVAPISTPSPLLPTRFNVLTYTPTPTSTSIPTLRPTVMSEPIPFTSFGTIFVQGINEFGSPSGVTFYDEPFRFFEGQPEYTVGFRFTMQIMMWHFTKNELTPTPTAIPTSNWKLSIYRYRADGTYTNQPVYETSLKTTFSSDSDPNQNPNLLTIWLSADIMRRELQTKVGDSRAFTFRLTDEHKKLQQQGYFYTTPYHLLSHESRIRGNYKDGITLGYPYSLQENETEFFRQGEFIVIKEPPGGFYRLSYIFDFVHAIGTPGASDLEKTANELSIKLFPYREDGDYSVNHSDPATPIGKYSIAYVLVVDLPIDYLHKNVSGDNKYYLQITDSTGTIIKDEYFRFIPDIP